MGVGHQQEEVFEGLHLFEVLLEDGRRLLDDLGVGLEEGLEQLGELFGRVGKVCALHLSVINAII